MSTSRSPLVSPRGATLQESIAILHSSTKLQHFFGVEVECKTDDLNTRRVRSNSTHSKTPRCSSNKRHGERKKQKRSATPRFSTFRFPKSTKSPKYPKLPAINTTLKRTKSTKKFSEWFDKKIKDNKPNKIKQISINTNANIIPIEHCSWKPTLAVILRDDILLNGLICFMKKSYNEENILFLQAVKKLNQKIDQFINDNIDDEKDEINTHIINIYNKYIKSMAKYQINLSYDCFMDSLVKQQQLNNMNLNQKKNIFCVSVDEIERLIIMSVLPSFYGSKQFQSVVRRSEYYAMYRIRHMPTTPNCSPSQTPTSPNNNLDGSPKFLCLSPIYSPTSPSSSVFTLSPISSTSALTPPVKIDISESIETFCEYNLDLDIKEEFI